MKKFTYLLVVFITFFFNLNGQNNNIKKDTTVEKIKVAVKETPPFIIKKDNEFSGISVDLWNKIANDLNLIYEFKEYKQTEFPKMLNDIESGEIDVCINPLTVTSNRLNRFNYSLPFYSTNMVIVVPSDSRLNFFSLISNFFTYKFISAISVLLIVIFIIGFIIWLVEKNKNKQFRKGINGWGDGFWWAAVTMTTVGYGDKAPKTSAGKIFGFIWMFTSIIIISSITGSIAASLTVNEINSQINSLDDLKKMEKIGTMKATSSENFLIDHNFNNINNDYSTILKGLKAVSDKKIDAFIYDEAILKHIINNNNLNNKLKILPYKINVIYYSYSLPKSNKKLLEKLNPTIVKELESVNWIGILNKYGLYE